MLNMGGVEFDVESDLPVSVDAGAYGDFLGAAGGADAHIGVRLTTAEFRGEGRLVQVFDADGAWTMFSDGTDRVFRSGVAGAPLWTAVLDKDFEHVTVHCGDRLVRTEKGLKAIQNPIRYPLDQILMMYVLARGRGMILHGCGVDFCGKGLLFLGKSGAGKSTLARLLTGRGACRLLSDDRIIVRGGVGGGFRMFGTPWPGEASVAENSGVALDALFFLSHAASNEIRPLAISEAATRLLQVASVPWHDAEVFPDTVSFCDRLLRTAPAHELRFEPSSAVAAVIEGWAGCSKQAPECARGKTVDQQDMKPGKGDQPAIRPVKPYCAGAAPEQDDSAEHLRCGHQFGRTGSGVRANFEKSLAVLAELPADAVRDGSSGFRAAQGNVADPDGFFGERLDGEFVAVMDKGEHAGAVGGEAQGIAPAEDVGGEPGEIGACDVQEVGCHGDAL